MLGIDGDEEDRVRRASLRAALAGLDSAVLRCQRSLAATEAATVGGAASPGPQRTGAARAPVRATITTCEFYELSDGASDPDSDD